MDVVRPRNWITLVLWTISLASGSSGFRSSDWEMGIEESIFSIQIRFLQIPNSIEFLQQISTENLTVADQLYVVKLSEYKHRGYLQREIMEMETIESKGNGIHRIRKYFSCYFITFPLFSRVDVANWLKCKDLLIIIIRRNGEFKRITQLWNLRRGGGELKFYHTNISLVELRHTICIGSNNYCDVIGL